METPISLEIAALIEKVEALSERARVELPDGVTAEKISFATNHLYPAMRSAIRTEHKMQAEPEPIGWLEAQAAPIGSGEKQRERTPAVEAFDYGVRQS